MAHAWKSAQKGGAPAASNPSGMLSSLPSTSTEPQNGNEGSKAADAKDDDSDAASSRAGDDDDRMAE